MLVLEPLVELRHLAGELVLSPLAGAEIAEHGELERARPCSAADGGSAGLRLAAGDRPVRRPRAAAQSPDEPCQEREQRQAADAFASVTSVVYLGSTSSM